MKIHHSNLRDRTHWLKKPMLSGKYQAWLLDSGSLTMQLQKHYAAFAVKPMMVAYVKPFLDETKPLKIAFGRTALIREVYLMGNEQAVVFAHSVLPRDSLRGRWLGLRSLGNRALGATLFANPRVQRTALSYKKLSTHHVLYYQATMSLKIKPTFLWARRSVFSLNCANIMVTEVFLPQLLAI